METQVIKIPAVNFDCVTPEGCVLVEVGHHKAFNGFYSPFPFKITTEYWSAVEIEKYSNFVADQYNESKQYEQEVQALDKSPEV